MQRIVIVLLEAYALALAWLHSLAGVQTDEAKYLLNIPYPHPPLLRWIMGLTASWPFQEMLWRLLLATMIVQAVWFVWDMTRDLPRAARIATAGAWLLSPSVFLQGGSVMLAPVTAVIALVMLWLLQRQRQGEMVAPEVWGLLWAVALLTAYQGVVLLPLAIAGVRRSAGPSWRNICSAVLPLCLLIVISLSNPLALATMLIHTEEGARLAFAEHAEGAAMLWLTAGAWIASIVGTLGLIAERRWEILAGFTLTALFVLASAPFPFYGILFLPWIVEGLRSACVYFSPPRGRGVGEGLKATLLCSGLIVGWIWIMPWTQVSMRPSEARMVMQEIGKHVHDGEIAIAGTFGHQWQYESPLPVRRYVPDRLEGVSAVVCLAQCESPIGWKKFEIQDHSKVDIWLP